LSTVLLVAAAGAVALMAGFAPPKTNRTTLLTQGVAAVVALGAVAIAPSLDLVILIVLALAGLQAVIGGLRPISVRLRAPAVACVLLAAGLAVTRFEGPSRLPALAAVLIAAGVAAAIGILPYIHEFDPEEWAAPSPIAWIGFLSPVVVVAVLSRVYALIPTAGAQLGAMLIGLGLVNVIWGSVAAWRTVEGARAWHYSFMADWGLALCGFGMQVADGRSAALLVLTGILLGRLPLYTWSRPALAEQTTQTVRPVNLLAAAMLAGAAPFAGFAAKVILLRGATVLYWPLALVLAVGLLLWLPSSLRLGKSLGLPRGRQAVGVAVALMINAAIGLYPQPVLSLAGL